MAYETPILTVSLISTNDLSAGTNQYKFVKLDTNGQIILCAATTDVPCGILQDTPKANQAGSVMVLGVSKIQGDVDLARGNLIGTSADGQAAVLVPGTDTTKYVVGQVLEDNSAAAGYATALINCANPHRAA